MKRRFVLALPALVACSRPEPRRAAIDPLLAVGRDLDEVSAGDEAFSVAELGRIANQIAESMTAVAPGEGTAARVSRLNQVIFGELGFVREVESTALDCVLLPLVLRGRRGSCVGLGSLYLALARSLALPLTGVLRPGHFHVRSLDGGAPQNFELLRRGESMPEAWYREKYPALSGASVYGRPLSASEVRGVVEFNVGNERRRLGRLAAARQAYERAVEHFPAFGEAHASLGAVLHLVGALEAAERAYAAAQRVDPALPGLARNIELLARERARH